MSEPRIIVYAPNVGVGGGLVLVRALVQAWPGDVTGIALLNDRGRNAIESGSNRSAVDVRWFGSNLPERWRAERTLRRISRPGDTILCFHSLPPLLPVQGRVICYVHNRLLVDVASLRQMSGWPRIRSTLERLVFGLFNRRIDRFLVQTPTMVQALATARSYRSQPIDVLPFIDYTALPPRTERTAIDHPREDVRPAERKFDFIFISDGPPHKNHRALFRAWELLAADGIRPSLALTLHPVRDHALHAEAARLAASGLAITDLGQLPHRDVLDLYAVSGALLFASYAETFGIPLLEAKAAGLPIVAAERDFVRDVCEPAATFDPHSARSIARAVKRFLGERAQSVVPVNPTEFIARLRDTARP